MKAQFCQFVGFLPAIMSSSPNYAVLCACVLSLVSPVQADTPGEALFDHDQLTGWKTVGVESFSVQRGILHCDGSGDYPTWLRSKDVYENFVLRLDYKIPEFGDTGIFLHAPFYGRNSKVGFEIQISDDRRDSRPFAISTGAVFGVLPPGKLVGRHDAWIPMEIRFDWPRLQVTIDGELVQDVDVQSHPELRYRLRRGYLGFQDLGKKAWFRNIRIQRLPDSQKPWQPLFTRKGLDGWDMAGQKVDWSLNGDELLARDGHGYLITKDRYRDFELFCYVQTSRHANGGIFCRWKQLQGYDRGFEVQIEDVPDSKYPTGSIYDHQTARDLPVIPGQWYPMQIRVQGLHAVVRVNGVTVADYEQLPVDRAGHIALQMHTDRGWIRVKDLKVKAL